MTKEQLKQLHQSIPPPPELAGLVAETIAAAPFRQRRRSGWKKTIAAFAACLCLFALSVNLSPAFAASLYELPLVGDVAMLFTFRETRQTDEAKNVVIRAPALRGVGDTALEQQINDRIAERIDLLQQQGDQMAQDYLEAYNATKGENDHAFWKVEINIGYQMKYSSPEIISFELYFASSAASSFEQQYFYNIDLHTGRDLTLEDLLGPDYLSLCNQAVEEGMARRLAQDPNAFYYSLEDDILEDDEFAFRSIRPDQPFYINHAGNPVIVFEKYEIAPGYMGAPEFEVRAQ